MKILVPFFIIGSLAALPGDVANQKRQEEPPPESAVGIALAAITNAVIDLDTVVLQIQGADDAPAVISSAENVATTIETQTTNVAASPMLTEDQAFSLVMPLNNLANTVNKTVDDVIAKRQIIVDNCFGQTTYQILVRQQSLASQFNQTAIAKVPEPFPGPAIDIVQPLFDALANGIAVFADQATPPPECSTTTTTTTSAATTSTTSAGNPVYPTGSPSDTSTSSSSYSTAQPPKCRRHKHY